MILPQIRCRSRGPARAGFLIEAEITGKPRAPRGLQADPLRCCERAPFGPVAIELGVTEQAARATLSPVRVSWKSKFGMRKLEETPEFAVTNEGKRAARVILRISSGVPGA